MLQFLKYLRKKSDLPKGVGGKKAKEREIETPKKFYREERQKLKAFRVKT